MPAAVPARPLRASAPFLLASHSAPDRATFPQCSWKSLRSHSLLQTTYFSRGRAFVPAPHSPRSSAARQQTALALRTGGDSDTRGHTRPGSRLPLQLHPSRSLALSDKAAGCTASSESRRARSRPSLLARRPLRPSSPQFSLAQVTLSPWLPGYTLSSPLLNRPSTRKSVTTNCICNRSLSCHSLE